MTDYNANGTINSRSVGTFTADATLTASFGGPAVSQNNEDTITGTIANFMDGTSPLVGMRVTLMRTDISTNAAATFGLGADGEANGMVGGIVAGSPVNSGTWNGAFFGDPADTVAAGERYPNSAAGEFNAQSSHGAVAGAFGAEKE